MSYDVSSPGTLFEFNGKLYETVSYAKDPTVGIKPVREEDYEKCECGRVLNDQVKDYVHYSRSLQEGIGKVYEVKDA